MDMTLIIKIDKCIGLSYIRFIQFCVKVYKLIFKTYSKF